MSKVKRFHVPSIITCWEVKKWCRRGWCSTSGFCCPVPGVPMYSRQGHIYLSRITVSWILNVPTQNTPLKSWVFLIPMLTDRRNFKSSEGASFLRTMIHRHKFLMKFYEVGPVRSYFVKDVLPRWTARNGTRLSIWGPLLRKRCTKELLHLLLLNW